MSSSTAPAGFGIPRCDCRAPRARTSSRPIRPSSTRPGFSPVAPSSGSVRPRPRSRPIMRCDLWSERRTSSSGSDDGEAELLRTVRGDPRPGPAGPPSLREVERADAVLILGEDPTNTAPLLDLAVRQAVLNAPLEHARNLDVPPGTTPSIAWSSTTSAARSSSRHRLRPRWTKSPPASAGRRPRTSPISASPSPRSSATASPPRAICRTGSLAWSDRWRRRSESRRDAADHRRDGIGKPRHDPGRRHACSGSRERRTRQAALCLVVPDCNSVGAGLFGAPDLGQAAAAAARGEIDNRNRSRTRSLTPRARSAALSTILDTVPHVVVLDHLEGPATDARRARPSRRDLCRVRRHRGQQRGPGATVLPGLRARRRDPRELALAAADRRAGARARRRALGRLRRCREGPGRGASRSSARSPTSCRCRPTSHGAGSPGRAIASPVGPASTPTSRSASRGPPMTASPPGLLHGGQPAPTSGRSDHALLVAGVELGAGAQPGSRRRSAAPSAAATPVSDSSSRGRRMWLSPSDGEPTRFTPRSDEWLLVPLHHLFGSETTEPRDPGRRGAGAGAVRRAQPGRRRPARRRAGRHPSSVEIDGRTSRAAVQVGARAAAGCAGLPEGLPGLSGLPAGRWARLRKPP